MSARPNLHVRTPDPRYGVLALLQGMVVVEALAFALLAGGADSPHASLDLVIAGIFAALVAISLLVLPRSPDEVLDVVIALTWIVVAFFAGTRSTPEGQMVVSLSVMLIAVYVSYSRGRRLAVIHLAGISIAMFVAIVVGGREATVYLAAWTAITIAATGWVVLTLRERDRHLRLLLENSADVVFHTRDGIFQWVSPSSYDVLGWRWSDLIGTRKSDLWHPDDREHAAEVRNQTVRGDVTHETMRLRRPDGSYLWIEATLRPYTDVYGYQGISGSLRDVSDRVAAQGSLAESERQQRGLAEALANSAEMQSRLVQNISHEFRTPLTVMRSPLTRLSRRASLEQADRDELDAALRASRRLATLVDDLIDVAQTGSGGHVTVREPVDVPAVTATAMEAFRPACDAAGIELTLVSRDVPVPLWLNEDAWTRIVTNLVSNAVRFTPEGSIHVVLEYDRQWLCLDVEDTGIGISEQDQTTVFTEFGQGSRPPVRGSVGTGIGLVVVRDLARDLNGDCHIESRDGEGTKAIVRVLAPRTQVTDTGSIEALNDTSEDAPSDRPD